MQIQTEQFNLPSHWLTALFNDDQSGFEDEDEFQFDAWSKEMEAEYSSFHAVDCEEYGFQKYHDAEWYGVLACDVHTVFFHVEPRAKESKAF